MAAGVALAIGLAAAGIVWLRSGKSGAAEKYSPRPAGGLTFTKDVAPIIFEHCSGCHRPGQSAPFNLLSFQDVKKHATDIADVTSRRYMPPWLPEQGYGQFVDERRLTVDQMGLIQQWVAEGAAEGKAPDLPPLPRWSGDWQLGQPDLVVAMPQPYTLTAEGSNVNRNFVVPVPIQQRRYVKGIEFHPGNGKIVHHAFVKVDRSGQARRLDAGGAEPGFSGLNPPGEVPDGHFLGWQPGRRLNLAPVGLPWRLEPGSDLVLQMHLNPSGKAERLQASVGLYFTDQPPTNTCFKILLSSLAIDIPAGATNYLVQDSYVLPVDINVLAILPHAHYSCKQMEVWATLPSGARQWLLLIKHWDFNWQGDYRYESPILLPAGSKLEMRFAYDNSTNNVRNPNHPPQLVSYGQQSKDEMAEVWLQVLPAHRENLTRLTDDYERKTARLLLEADQFALRKDPSDASAHTDLGMMLAGQGKHKEAEEHFRTAIAAHADFPLAHYQYGVLLRRLGRLAEAQAQFAEDLRLNTNDFKAHGNLGAIALEQGDLATAKAEFESALRLNPEDALARQGFERVAEALKRRGVQRAGLRVP